MLPRLLLLTCGEQGGTGISEAVKREITQSLQEGHGLDKGVAIARECSFFVFETCENIYLANQGVRCMACL